MKMAKSSVESTNYLLAKLALVVTAMLTSAIYFQPTFHDLSRESASNDSYGFFQVIDALLIGLVGLVSWLPAYQIVISLACLASIVWLLIANSRDAQRNKPEPPNYAAVPTKPSTKNE
jgi:hypothetical protein